MNTLNNWGPAAVIVIGYLLAYYFQNKKLEEFKGDLYKYIDAKFETINFRLTRIEEDVKDLRERTREIEKATKIIH